MNLQEAIAAYRSDAALLAERGVVLPDVVSYIPDEGGIRRDYSIAMDAQPTLFTQPNAAIPMFLTTMIDPEVIRVLFTPNKAAQIFGEVKKGTWLDDTVVFQVVEHVGEVSSYGDFNENGHTGINTNWPQRQAYLYQTIEEYGDREVERAGLARLNWVSEMDQAAATVMNKFANLTYFFGVGGLQNFGLLNDASLSASLTPATKAWGGTAWISSGQIKATANEIYADIQALFLQLVVQSGGAIEAEDKLVLAMSPGSAVALTGTNAFNVNVKDLLKKNFPNIRFETATQYGVLSATNQQGITGGNFVQLIAETVEGQKTGFSAFSEKMRSHPIVRGVSSLKKKLTGGTWGSVIRLPFAIASMIGV